MPWQTYTPPTSSKWSPSSPTTPGASGGTITGTGGGSISAPTSPTTVVTPVTVTPGAGGTVTSGSGTYSGTAVVPGTGGKTAFQLSQELRQQAIGMDGITPSTVAYYSLGATYTTTTTPQTQTQQQAPMQQTIKPLVNPLNQEFKAQTERAVLSSALLIPGISALAFTLFPNKSRNIIAQPYIEQSQKELNIYKTNVQTQADIRAMIISPIFGKTTPQQQMKIDYIYEQAQKQVNIKSSQLGVSTKEDIKSALIPYQISQGLGLGAMSYSLTSAAAPYVVGAALKYPAANVATKVVGIAGIGLTGYEGYTAISSGIETAKTRGLGAGIIQSGASFAPTLGVLTGGYFGFKEGASSIYETAKVTQFSGSIKQTGETKLGTIYDFVGKSAKVEYETPFGTATKQMPVSFSRQIIVGEGKSAGALLKNTETQKAYALIGTSSKAGIYSKEDIISSFKNKISFTENKELGIGQTFSIEKGQTIDLFTGQKGKVFDFKPNIEVGVGKLVTKQGGEIIIKPIKGLSTQIGISSEGEKIFALKGITTTSGGEKFGYGAIIIERQPGLKEAFSVKDLLITGKRAQISVSPEFVTSTSGLKPEFISKPSVNYASNIAGAFGQSLAQQYALTPKVSSSLSASSILTIQRPFSVSLVTPKIQQRNILGMNLVQPQKTSLIPITPQLITPMPMQGTGSISIQSPASALIPIQVMKSAVIPSSFTQYRGSFIPIIPSYLPSFGLGFGSTTGQKRKKGKQPTKYQPSLRAMFQGITSPKIPKMSITGIGLRPIIRRK